MGLAIDGTQQTFVLPAAITGAIDVRRRYRSSRNEANVNAVRIDEIYLSATS